jgi:integrase
MAMTRRSSAALATITTPHGQVLIRSQYARKQGGWVLVLDGDPLALELLEPRNRLCGTASHRRTLTPPGGAVASTAIRGVLAQYQARWALVLQAAKRGATPTGRDPIRTLGELVEAHGCQHAAGLRASSRAAYAKRWRTLYRVIQPITPLTLLDQVRVQQAVADLAAAGLAPITIRNLMKALVAVLDWAEAVGVLDRAPTTGLTLPPVIEVHRDTLDDAAVTALLAAAETHGTDALLLVALAALAGLRAGEVLAVQWADIDLAAKTLRVRNRGAFVTKNGRSRVVPLSERLLAILAEHEQDAGFVVRPLAPARTGRQRWSFRKTYDAVLAAAGLEHLPFHGLRRTFATRAVEKGVPISKVRLWLGHSSIVVTQGYVQHGVGFDGDIDRATA